MKSHSLSELKHELQSLPAAELVDICVSLAKYKKDNKDYLSYLLVESYDKPGFVTELKGEIEREFVEIKTQPNLYYAKKSLRKVLRMITRYSRYVNDKSVSCDLSLFFCKMLKTSGIPLHKSQQILNMYEQQLKKIRKLIDSLHEDLQYDYQTELESLSTK